MDPYKCYAIFLTEKEADIPANLGWAFVSLNKARAVVMPGEIGDKIYDKGNSHFVYENKAYVPYRDFIEIDTANRYYLCKPTEYPMDQAK